MWPVHFCICVCICSTGFPSVLRLLSASASLVTQSDQTGNNDVVEATSRVNKVLINGWLVHGCAVLLAESFDGSMPPIHNYGSPLYIQYGFNYFTYPCLTCGFILLRLAALVSVNPVGISARSSTLYTLL